MSIKILNVLGRPFFKCTSTWTICLSLDSIKFQLRHLISYIGERVVDLKWSHACKKTLWIDDYWMGVKKFNGGYKLWRPMVSDLLAQLFLHTFHGSLICGVLIKWMGWITKSTCYGLVHTFQCWKWTMDVELDSQIQ